MPLPSGAGQFPHGGAEGFKPRIFDQPNYPFLAD
jgi:hypothetical protein